MTTIDDLPPTTLAGLPRRLVGVAIDIPFWFVGMFVTVFVIALANSGELSGEGAPVLLFIVAWIVVWEAVWTVMGGTPGKRIAGFSVRRLDGTRLGLARSILRAVVKFGQLYLFFAFVISMVTIATSRRAQALHDMVVGSACFEREALDLLRSPQAATTTATTVPPVPAPPAAPARPASRPAREQHRGPFL